MDRLKKIRVGYAAYNPELRLITLETDELMKFGDACWEAGQAEAKECEEWLNHIPTPVEKPGHYIYLEGRDRPVHVPDWIYESILATMRR